MFKLLGFLFLGIGLIGTVVPLLPTTPFILLAAGCFAKSSPKWHAWLLNHKTLGPLIKDWQEHRCLNRKAKWTAQISIIVFGMGSVFLFLDKLQHQIWGICIVCVGLGYVSILKTCTAESHEKQV